MKWAMAVTMLCAVVMGVTLLYGFTQGDLAADGRVLMSIPWGIVSLVDVYVGFTLFSAWVIFRERSLVVGLAWTAAIMVLGFLIASVYALLALRSSGGDWRRFWLGGRTGEV